MNTLKPISHSIYDRIEHNNKNSFYKIGYYNKEKNQFEEVARWRNSYNKSSGANYGLLQIWAITFNFASYETQGGYNTAGGYNKPIANLESCLYQLSVYLKKAYNKDVKFSNCGSIESNIHDLMEVLQNDYNVKLFSICIE